MMPMTLAEASRRIARKDISPVELTQCCLDRIERLNGSISAFITVTADRALADARASEARIMKDGPRTPLDGIPIAHKDMLDTAGIATTAHSKLLQGNVPTRDAAVVTRLAEAGTVLLGKLATLEFALAGPSFDLPWPPAKNPWNTKHFTSGSSSGTAAAIAAGMILGGTGTDTGGSIRAPAAACGTSGIKPTYGRCSRTGVIPLAPSLDQVGPMAWTAEDCAMLLQQMAGYDASDRVSANVPVPDFSARIGKSVRGMRVGVIRHFHEKDFPASKPVLRAIDASVEILRAEGAETRDIHLSPLADYSAANKIIMNCEAAALHEQGLKARFWDYGERMRYRVLLGGMLAANDYIQAQRRRHELGLEFAEAMKTVDVVITATAAGEAPLIDEISLWDGLDKPSFIVPWNLTGFPAIAVRMGFGENKLPISVQIGGRAFDEATLFQVAHLLETVTSWVKVRPELPKAVSAA
jgi:aspartyl-tRNA(Asn)/glutamyl-tRNA(Gln) amidotransferase subunit A